MVVETVTAGILAQEEVRVIRMSRETFVDHVRECIEEHYDYPEAMLKELMPVAQSMTMFPFDSWLVPSRGCGCVVGEYLVARAAMDRADLVNAMVATTREEPRAATMLKGPRSSVGYTSVSEQLRDHPLRGDLVEFGDLINDRLMAAVHAEPWGDNDSAQAILIED